MRKGNRKGFTLIELLVVITIIGILATGAVTVYTSQIQKARDTTRIGDIKALQGAAEQVYQDTTEYPDVGDFSGTGSSVWDYLPRLPQDPKHGSSCNNTGGATVCAYMYGYWADSNWIAWGSYEISTSFENTGNVSTKAVNTDDAGNDNARLEIGLRLDTLNTNATAVSDTVPGASVTTFSIGRSGPLTATSSSTP